MAEQNWKFDPAFHLVPEAEPLSNMERALLRDMAKPGLPLWKILRELCSYREDLITNLAQPGLDFDDEDTRKKLKIVQAGIAGITDVLGRFENALSDVNEGDTHERS